MDNRANTEGFGEGLRHIRLLVDFLQPIDESIVVDSVISLLHPEVSILGAPGLGPARGYEGREEFAEYFREIAEEGVWIQSDVSEIKLHPSGAILVSATLRLTTSNGTDSTPAWFVFTIRDGLIASLETHLDHSLALESVRATSTRTK